MTLSGVHTALRDAAVEALDGISTHHENQPFTIPSGEKWAQIFFLPNQPSVGSLGPSGQDELTGIFQIDLNYPIGEGDGEADDDFETIRGSFGAGTWLSTDDTYVVVKSCGRSSGRIVGEYWRISITIGWYARLER